MKTIFVNCSYCGKQFERRKGQYKEAIKLGWRQFCSFKCRDDIRRFSSEKICSNPNCNKKIMVSPRQLRRSNSGKFYCSHSCAAIVNNSKRTNKLPDNPCSHCNKLIHWSKKYCSRKCTSESRKMTTTQFKESVKNKIREFYDRNGRIPVKREMQGAYVTARFVFGTWNRAIVAAGFKSNPVMFARRFKALDGHMCDSFTEKIIDDWLSTNNIPHKIHVPYPDFPKYKSDFLIKDTFIEFVGLEGEHVEYTRLLRQKRELVKKYGLNLIEIHPKDIYPENNLGYKLRSLIK